MTPHHFLHVTNKTKRLSESCNTYLGISSRAPRRALIGRSEKRRPRGIAHIPVTPLSHRWARHVIPSTCRQPRLERHCSPNLPATHICFVNPSSSMTENAQPPPDSTSTAPVEGGATMNPDTNAEPSQPDAMNLDGANDAGPSAQNGTANAELSFEPRIPDKKDATLREFLAKMDDYAPIVCLHLASTASSTVSLTCARFLML